jgi:hypothetical protein
LTEKLEHSLIVDILSLAVYAYFGFVAYNNLGYNRNQILSISGDTTVIAVQLAGLLIFVNILEMVHDKYISGHS